MSRKELLPEQFIRAASKSRSRTSWAVRDNEQLSAGYNDRHTNANVDDFEYDTFGNLIMNRDKNIQTVVYNHLNLPVKVTFGNGASLAYTYTANGTKIKKTATDSQNATTSTEYVDGFQYTDEVLDFFPHSEGYVKATESGGQLNFNYVFNFTDHLGNIRLKYTEHPQTGELEILEENHYYPYGLTHQGYNGEHRIVGLEQPGTPITLIPVTPGVIDTYKYKFGGKEYQDEFDINSYDFGARNYDPALGRWMNVDPMAELMRRHSPYNYAFNNPVYFIDPDGMIPIPGAGGSGLLVSDTKYLGTSDTSTGGFGSYVNVKGGDESTSVYVPKNGDIDAGAYQSMFKQKSNDIANMDVSLGGGDDCEDCGGGKKSNNIKNAVPCVQCHHTATFSQGNGNFSLKDRQSGYIQHGGNMRSDFIGSVVGKDGVLYGSVDGLVYPSDRSSRIKLLNFIIKLKGGGEIGSKIVEMLFADEAPNIKTFYYSTYDTIPTRSSRTPNGLNLRGGYKLIEKRNRGYIIDSDTIR